MVQSGVSDFLKCLNWPLLIDSHIVIINQWLRLFFTDRYRNLFSPAGVSPVSVDTQHHGIRNCSLPRSLLHEGWSSSATVTTRRRFSTPSSPRWCCRVVVAGRWTKTHCLLLPVLFLVRGTRCLSILINSTRVGYLQQQLQSDAVSQHYHHQNDVVGWWSWDGERRHIVCYFMCCSMDGKRDVCLFL